MAGIPWDLCPTRLSTAVSFTETLLRGHTGEAKALSALLSLKLVGSVIVIPSLVNSFVFVEHDTNVIDMQTSKINCIIFFIFINPQTLNIITPKYKFITLNLDNY